MILKVETKDELLTFLINNLKHQSRTNIKTLLTKEQVLVNGTIQKQFNFQLQPNDEILINWNKNRNSNVEKGINILYEDNYILIVDKSDNLLSISTQKNSNERTAYNILTKYVKKINPKNRIFIVHRLDRETSGVMIFAKSENIKYKLQENWKELIIEREYSVLAEGKVLNKEGRIQSYLKENKAFVTYSVNDDKSGGKLAITNYKVEDIYKNFTFLKVYLETGRKNQIRVHMSDIGHPILGDKKYGSTNFELKRLGLHASSLKFFHPITKKIMEFKSDLPIEFKKLLKK